MQLGHSCGIMGGNKMRLEIYAEYDITNKKTNKKERMRGKVVKPNIQTVIVVSPDGKHIKRHFKKHNVKYLPHEEY